MSRLPERAPNPKHHRVDFVLAGVVSLVRDRVAFPVAIHFAADRVDLGRNIVSDVLAPSETNLSAMAVPMPPAASGRLLV